MELSKMKSRLTAAWRPGIWAVLLIAALLAPAAASAQPATAPPADRVASRPDPDDVPTRLSLSFYLVDIESVDDLEQEFTADLYIVARWRDGRLAAPAGAEQVAERILPMSQLWQPQIGILNRRSLQSTLPEVARVDPLGNVEHTKRIRGQFASPLDLRRFPFDSQRLEIHFISYRYGPDELEITAGRALRQEEFSVAGWSTGEPASEVTPLEIPASGSRAGLTLGLEAERQRNFYMLTLVLPLTLIALMAWAVFWIDPSLLPSQLGIATASVFTLIAFRLSLVWSLPKVSYMTTADGFVMAVTLLVFAALGQTVLTGRLSKQDRDELAQKLDRWGRWIYLGALLVLLLVALT